MSLALRASHDTTLLPPRLKLLARLDGATGFTDCYSEVSVVLKAISNSVLSCLMVVTLVWGGCISCPQFFMFPNAEESCCEKDGQCKRPAKTAPVKECKQMPLEPAGSASAHVELAVAAVEPIDIFVLPLVGPTVTWIHSKAPVFEHSPPDLNVLHSTFLV